jgi:predicted esterase
MNPRSAPAPAPLWLLAATLAGPLTWAVPPAGAQALDPDTLPRGEIIESIACRADPSQRYALYLPSRYRPDTRWPVLILMDPRGRALVPLRRVVEPAERHGYVVLSSHNTLSDGPPEPNFRAMTAMLTDLVERYAVDRRRLYFAGFSGTARVAWLFAPRLSVPLAGILGFGAGLPTSNFFPAAAQSLGAHFGFFGGAGVTDFNFDEVRALDGLLDRYGIAHRLRFHDGPHAWPPAEVFAEALDWMELLAVKAGLRAAAAVPIDSIYARRLAEARELETAGRTYEAFVRYSAIAEDFRGLRPTEPAQAKADELEQSAVVLDTRRRLDEFALRTSELQRRIEFVAQMIRSGSPLGLELALEHLEITRLREEAADADDPLGALGAQRALEWIFVHTAFYEPRQHLEQGEPHKALAALAIADAVKPGHPRVCQFGAQAQLALGNGNAQGALDGLECLVDAGWLWAAERLAADPAFEPLHGEARYQALVERLRR